MTKISTLIVCAYLSLSLSACASFQPRDEIIVPDLETPVVQASKQIQAAHQNAQESSELALSKDYKLVPARYNPARCNCPPFELFLAGAWKRAFLDWQEPSEAMEPTGDLDAIEEAARKSNETGTFPIFLFRVQQIDDSVTAPNELSYPLFSINKSLELGPISTSQALKLILIYNPPGEDLQNPIDLDES